MSAPRRVLVAVLLVASAGSLASPVTGSRSVFTDIATVSGTVGVAQPQLLIPTECIDRDLGPFSPANTSTGTAGNDWLIAWHATSGRLIQGLGGFDVIVGWYGDDCLDGGDAGDIIEGGTGSDVILGGDGNDILSGGNGRDYIDGGPGWDKCFGTPGQDTILNCELVISGWGPWGGLGCNDGDDDSPHGKDGHTNRDDGDRGRRNAEGNDDDGETDDDKKGDGDGDGGPGRRSTTFAPGDGDGSVTAVPRASTPASTPASDDAHPPLPSATAAPGTLAVEGGGAAGGSATPTATPSPATTRSPQSPGLVRN